MKTNYIRKLSLIFIFNFSEMKRSSEPGKFYYDVTIEHDPEHADKNTL